MVEYQAVIAGGQGGAGAQSVGDNGGAADARGGKAHKHEVGGGGINDSDPGGGGCVLLKQLVTVTWPQLSWYQRESSVGAIVQRTYSSSALL